VKTLLVSTTEYEGGAGRAANRLLHGLNLVGVNTHLLVQSRMTGDPYIVSAMGKLAKGLDLLRPTLDQLPLYIFGPAGLNRFATAWFPDNLVNQATRLHADVIHLHWVAKGHLRIETLRKLKRPWVWTLHDMWPITGGCFHSWDCLRYQSRCGACPQLNSTQDQDLSRWIWSRKQRAWQKAPLTLVCPSEWIAEKARHSLLFEGKDIRVIPNGLDTQRYRPLERDQARQWLKLPIDKKLIMFSVIKRTDNPYKGFNLLPQFLTNLNSLGWEGKVELVLLGQAYAQDVQGISIPVHRLGHLEDDMALALAYAAADVYLSLSVTENLPYTIMEALSCGTPVSAFRVGGIPELVDHQSNGYLAAVGDIQELASGVDWLLEDSHRYQNLSEQARQKVVRNYDLPDIARRHMLLYQALVESSTVPMDV
jgi:glycosyltransferase involved in cell wall biosynthesis